MSAILARDPESPKKHKSDLKCNLLSPCDVKDVFLLYVLLTNAFQTLCDSCAQFSWLYVCTCERSFEERWRAPRA